MKISAEEKAEKTTNYLLDTCYKEHRAHLSVDQIKLITEMVRQRLSGSIQKDEFFKKLDLPEREGGVGLNSKTVKAITDELELILILGFGIVQTNEIDTEERKNVGTQTKEVKLDTGVSLQDAINMEQEREEELKRK